MLTHPSTENRNYDAWLLVYHMLFTTVSRMIQTIIFAERHLTASAMTSSKFKLRTVLLKVLHNVSNPFLKGQYKFQVDIPINARDRAV